MRANRGLPGGPHSHALGRLKNWQDNESWRDFFDTYWKLISGFAVKRGLTHQEAEEVVQDTVLAVAKSIPGFEYSQVDILHVGRGGAAIQPPGVSDPSAAGKLPLQSEDYFYYVMELADDQATGGQINPDNYHPRTLKSALLFHSRLPFEECVSIGIALTTALEHLHQNGLVHRDVKPSNIIFVNGVAKLADIGLVTVWTRRARMSVRKVSLRRKDRAPRKAICSASAKTGRNFPSFRRTCANCPSAR